MFDNVDWGSVIVAVAAAWGAVTGTISVVQWNASRPRIRLKIVDDKGLYETDPTAIAGAIEASGPTPIAIRQFGLMVSIFPDQGRRFHRLRDFVWSHRVPSFLRKRVSMPTRGHMEWPGIPPSVVTIEAGKPYLFRISYDDLDARLDPFRKIGPDLAIEGFYVQTAGYRYVYYPLSAYSRHGYYFLDVRR